MAAADDSMSRAELLCCREQGSGPPLLLIHGLMISGDMFEPVVEHFAARHRVIVPDLRGHGRSRALPPPYTVPQLASDLVRLLDHLGIVSTTVLGYSNGGAIAQQFVLDNPGRCDRLVLACTYAFNMATRRERLEGRFVPLLVRLIGMKRFAALLLAQGLKRVPPDRARWVGDLIADQNRDLMIAAWKAGMAFDSRRRLSEIRCPTLIVAGSDDTAVPAHHAQMLHEGIAGSTLAVIDGADHALIWARTDDFVRLVDQFVDS
jgi:pimeloyl-ACP methyl ester carboxylesterase